MTFDDFARLIALHLTDALRCEATDEQHAVTWTVADAMEQTGLGRDFIRTLIHRGDIEAFRIDPGNPKSKLLIVPESVIAWRDRQVALQKKDREQA